MLFLVFFLNDASTLAYGRPLRRSVASSSRYARPLDFETFSDENYSPARGRATLGPEDFIPKKSTKKLNQEETYFSTTSNYASKSGRERQFQAATHGVPSGPNPESNK
ncbi:hypothetical protein LIER_43596 [Lithospermum erythrorhizon]|uniref:Uncharacterized protein n=1 Tax=Lithospermum erythrorhizon TaxID=34254 RepID=A0AAV3QF30_LITER